jgi:type I restriction enzyme S subunit
VQLSGGSPHEKAGAMSGEKTKLVPKLRFPEFKTSADWQIKPFQKLFTIGSGRDYKHLSKGSFPVYGSGGYMLSVDDFLYDGESVCIGRKGTINNPMFVTGKFWTVDTLFYTHSFQQCLPKFIYAIFQKIEWLKHNEAGGVPSLSKTIIEKIQTAVPDIPEQEKIADCLSSLDELIAAQAKKIQILKTHKKGLMQQLFPREGETQPRLRFPEFQNSGDWVIEPIGDKVELLSGYPFDGPDISQDCSGVPLLRGINVTEGRVRHNPEIDRYFTGSVDSLEKYMLQLNDLVIGMDGSKVGKNSALITSIDAGAILIQRVARLRAKSIDLIRFIFQQINSSKFHRYVDKINTSSGIPHISAKQIREFCIAFPSDLEQQRIADCLTSLDNLITAATQELETLKTHKKGLMQQLFPSVEAVEA